MFYYYTKISILFFFSLFFAGASCAVPGSSYVVTAVHDGDTISIRAAGSSQPGQRAERLRLTGIDAPEMKQGKWGWEAKKRLSDIINRNNRVVNVEFDVEQRDKYGRLLGYIWSKDGHMINERMVEDGYAVLYTIPPNVRYAGRLSLAQKRARSKGLGIWGPEGLRQRPSDWRKEHPSDRPHR
jgi:micrococcal nuclease